MTKRSFALALCLVLAGCTRDVAGPVPPVAPIGVNQVSDLLSPTVEDGEGNLFTTVMPEDCSGIAREVDPPFIIDFGPAATDGGHWDADDGRETSVQELVGVYHVGFDPTTALAQARGTIASCRNLPITVTSASGSSLIFELLPEMISGSPNIALWSLQSEGRGCDNAFVAAHNAAIEITTCAEVNGYDVLSLAQDALKRIDALANTTA